MFNIKSHLINSLLPGPMWPLSKQLRNVQALFPEIFYAPFQSAENYPSLVNRRPSSSTLSLFCQELAFSVIAFLPLKKWIGSSFIYIFLGMAEQVILMRSLSRFDQEAMAGWMVALGLCPSWSGRRASVMPSSHLLHK